MKKILTAVSISVAIFAFSACSSNVEVIENNPISTTTVSTTSESSAEISDEIDESSANISEAVDSGEVGNTIIDDTSDEVSSSEEIIDTPVEETEIETNIETIVEEISTISADETSEIVVTESETVEEIIAATTAATTVAATIATTTTSITPQEPKPDETKILVAYFSYSGNTRAIAEKINNEVDGDLFEINTTYDYPSSYSDVLDVAQQEQRDNARPALSATVDNMDDYDVVFIGYPNWWGDMPMVVYSFLDTYDLSGKTVVPFVTSGGSGFSSTISDITNAEPNADIAEGLSISDSAINNSDSNISDWLDRLGL